MRGLQYHSETHPDFAGTARYLNFISNIWKIVSVKAPYKGMVYVINLNFELLLVNLSSKVHSKPLFFSHRKLA